MTISAIDGPRGKIYVRTEKLDSLLQFLPYRHPINSDSELLLHKNVTFTANVRVNAINTDKPPGYANYTLISSTGNTNVYTSNNAICLGKRWADWMEYFGYIRGMGESPDGLYGGAIRAINFGVLQYSGKSLMFNPSDGINGNSNSPYHANAILRNAGTLQDNSLTLGDYMSLALSTLKSELDARNLCYPKYFVQDLPELLSNGTGTSGWIQNAINNSRYSTEEVYREWNGVSWTSRTLKYAYEEALSPTFSLSEPWDNGNVNRNFTIRMQPYINRINDHALSFTIYQSAKTVFPQILCSNYSICHPISASSQKEQFWGNSHNWFRYPAQSYLNNRYLEADFQSPVIYSPNMDSNNIYAYNPIYNTGEVAPQDGGHVFGSSEQDVYRNYCSQMVHSCARLENSLPVLAWTEAPHEQIQAGSYPIYDANENDMSYIWAINYNNGATRWVVNNSLSQEPGANASVANTRNIQLLSSINSVISLIRSQSRVSRIRKIS